MLEKFRTLVVLGLFDGIFFLVGLAREDRGVAITSILEVKYLAVHPIMFDRFRARPRVESQDTHASFAEKLHGHAAAGSSADHDCIISLCRHV
jgi:hypothetical protein